ncbi:unnamed protein product, partial [Pylaiella littoralis]
ESAQIAADDTEATALSGGTLGRQQRSGQLGRTRATVYRGDPATFDGNIGHQISSVLSMVVNKYADPNRGGAGSGGGLGGASVSGGGGG